MQKKVLVEIKVQVLLSYDEQYANEDHINFHLNDSCHCISHELKAIGLAVTEKDEEPITCGCFCTESKFIRLATEDDLANDQFINI